MTPDKKTDIQRSIIRAMSGFGVDTSKAYQSMGMVGLSQMFRDIPLNELVSVLKSMEGVILDFEVSAGQVRIPTRYFIDL